MPENFGEFRETLLDKATSGVQKLCRRIMDLLQPLHEQLIAAAAALTDFTLPCFRPICKIVTSGEIGLCGPAPKEQPPRKLSGKRTVVTRQHLERDTGGLEAVRRCPPTG
jgi:hypothetical protein